MTIMENTLIAEEAGVKYDAVTKQYNASPAQAERLLGQLLNCRVVVSEWLTEPANHLGLTDERIEAAFNEKDAVGNWVAGGCTMAGFKRAVRWTEARLATLSAPVAPAPEVAQVPACGGGGSYTPEKRPTPVLAAGGETSCLTGEMK